MTCRFELRTGCLIGVGLLLLSAGCRTIPDDPVRPPHEVSLEAASSGPWAEASARYERRGLTPSGFLLLNENADALRWRLALADSAVSSLDLQYYLYYSDLAGAVLLDALLRAADRGVRIRLLVDDMLFFGKGEGLAALNSHPNFTIRLHNPWKVREGLQIAQLFEFLTRMDELNQRMHNKVMIADGRIAIVGGRNVGDAYFGLSEKSNFHDLDVLTMGPIVGEISQTFDGYWNSEMVLGEQREATDEDRAKLAAGRVDLRKRLDSDPRLSEIPRGQADWSDRIAEIPGRLVPGVGRVVVDEAEPQEGEEGESYEGLSKAFQGAERDILIENAYWIPGEGLADTMAELERRKVRTRVVTNSLGSHDVPAVNGAFKKYRAKIVEGGIDLYELRADAAVKSVQDTPPVDSEFLGLHTKAFVLDGDVVYVGSHNLDPRSHVINTEMGLLIESPQLGAELTALIERDMLPENSWHVVLGENGKPVWVAGDERHTSQPSRGLGQRIADWFFGILPIEDQL